MKPQEKRGTPTIPPPPPGRDATPPPPPPVSGRHFLRVPISQGRDAEPGVDGQESDTTPTSGEGRKAHARHSHPGRWAAPFSQTLVQLCAPKCLRATHLRAARVTGSARPQPLFHRGKREKERQRALSAGRGAETPDAWGLGGGHPVVELSSTHSPALSGRSILRARRGQPASSQGSSMPGAPLLAVQSPPGSAWVGLLPRGVALPLPGELLQKAPHRGSKRADQPEAPLPRLSFAARARSCSSEPLFSVRFSLPFGYWTGVRCLYPRGGDQLMRKSV